MYIYFSRYVVAVPHTYQDISDGYSIPDEIHTTLAFSNVNWCKIDVFTSNIMVLHHKMSQAVKINVNRYTNIYLLMNLFKMNQFIFISSCISALFSYIQQTNIFNHFVFLLLLIVGSGCFQTNPCGLSKLNKYTRCHACSYA